MAVRNPPGMPNGGNRRRNGMNDHRISNCSACGRGIFAYQKHHWSRTPLGLVHDECPDPILSVNRA